MKNQNVTSIVDTVGILNKDLGIDYFSFENSPLTPLKDTPYRELFNQWRSCGSSGADLRVELAKYRKSGKVHIVLTDGEFRIIKKFPFSKDGLDKAIKEMKEYK